MQRFFRIPIPWRGVLFSEQAILRLRRERFRPTDKATRYQDITGGLNLMRYSEFLKTATYLGWTFEFLDVNPQLKKLKPIYSLSSVLTSIPHVQDYVAGSVYAVLRLRQAGARNENSCCRRRVRRLRDSRLSVARWPCGCRGGYGSIKGSKPARRNLSGRRTGLQELVAKGVQEGRLRAKESSVDAFADVDAAIVCVSTPSMPDGSVDIRPMMRVFGVLAEAAEKFGSVRLVLVRSTIAPAMLRRVLDRHRAAPFDVVANPEFLRETAAIQDFDRPPFLVFGSDRPEAARAAAEIFASVPGPRHFLALESALLVKYASNAFHGLKIAFANEMGSLCDAAGANPIEVMKVFCEDTSLNISRAYLRPGFAFGGSCLPERHSRVAVAGELERHPSASSRGRPGNEPFCASFRRPMRL